MERDKPSVMIRVPTPLVPIVRQLSALYREARQQRDGYDGKKQVDASASTDVDAEPWYAGADCQECGAVENAGTVEHAVWCGKPDVEKPS